MMQPLRAPGAPAQAWGGAPQQLDDPALYGFSEHPHLWPVTPLGIPNVPPPLPPLPDCVLSPPAVSGGFPTAAEVPQKTGGGVGAGGLFQALGGVAPPLPPLPAAIFAATASSAEASKPAVPVLPGQPTPSVTRSSPPPATALAPAQFGEQDGDEDCSALPQEPHQKKDDDWTPVDKLDRRTFFHTKGKGHTFHNAESNGRHVESEYFDFGTKLRLQVTEVHFSNPRVKVMQGQPAPLPTMLKWSQEKFDEQELECAQIAMGDYWVWSAVGIPSNRVLYAMKRKEVQYLNAKVVEPPPVANPDEDIDLTYGACIQGIQLVP
mmetsp:Transcript_68531/g.198852  ORF Transcript_68531/g.198852 Transcript_68531/m.198852 type:complete len:321 (+) Transcript_68531:161-1123(+)